MSTSQLADDENESVDVDGELKLVASVFYRLRSDMKSRNPIHRAETQAWFNGAFGSIYVWADILGMEPHELRERLINAK